MNATIRHIEDLKNSRTPLTIIEGVGNAIAKKLLNGGINTVMGLSVCSPVKLVALGVQQHVAQKIVDAAQQLINQFQPAPSKQLSLSDEEAEGEVKPTKPRTVILNGREVTISEKDFEKARIIGIPVEDFMYMDKETQDQQYRIAASMVREEEAPLVDHEAFDLENLTPMAAPEFVQKRIKHEIDAHRKAETNRHKTFEKTASFVEGIVHGEEIDGTGMNVNPVKDAIGKKLSKEELETEVYLPNQRKAETRLEAKKAQDDSVKMVIDDLLKVD